MAYTKQQFNTLEDLFSFYNQSLFGDQLRDTLICLARHKGAAGLFSADRWYFGSKPVHEIVINPDNIAISEIEWHQTLVHEMCHLWQQDFGTPSRKCYHNKEWAVKMIQVGLVPSSTGQPGGKTTGQHMSDYPAENGLFINAFNSIQSDAYKNLKLPINPKKTTSVSLVEGQESGSSSKAGVKQKYTCSCGVNVWGKPGLSITCNLCKEIFD